MTPSGWKLSLEAADSFTDALGDMLMEMAREDCFPSLADFEIDAKRGMRLLEVYYPSAPDSQVIDDALARVAAAFDCAVPDYDLSPLPDLNWVTESQKQLHPVRAGRFYVYGSHDAHTVPDTAIPLHIDAGMAFGTGQHETTRGCLLAISDLTRKMSPQRCLDVGTGTGVLAMAMAHMWKCPIIATDIDPIATRTATDNIRLNTLPLNAAPATTWGIATLTAAGLHHPALKAQAPYDVIVANILANPLKKMAPHLAASLSPQGRLILSGLLDHQEAAVLARYRPLGLVLEKRYALKEWRALTLKFVG